VTGKYHYTQFFWEKGEGIMRLNLLTGVRLATLCFAGILLVGCASAPPAPVSSAAKNVVVAKLALNASNQSNSMLNGVWTETLSMKLLNWETKENFTATATVGQGGLVTFADLPAGTYSIRELGVSVVYMTNTIFSSTYKPAGALFDLVEGKINNLGRIEWKLVKADSSYAVDKYAEVQADAKKLALAKVGLEWAEVKLTTEE